MAAIPGTQVIAKIVPTDDQERYATHEDFYGQGGYVGINTTLFNLTAGKPPAIPFDRQKAGQIIYNAASNDHYFIRSVGNGQLSAYGYYDPNILTTDPLIPFSSIYISPFYPTGASDPSGKMTKAMIYEYTGSFLETSYLARNSSNKITTYRGWSYNPGVIPIQNNNTYEYSAILAGCQNKIVAGPNTQFFNSLIVGGSANTISHGSFSFIGGGIFNSLVGNDNAIVGGRLNRIGGSYTGVFIGGGSNNLIGGTYIDCSYSGIVAGRLNSLLGTYNLIGGGEQNTASGQYNFIGSGLQNSAAGAGDSIVGGIRNRTAAAGIAGTVLLNVQYSSLTIDSNYILDTKSFIAGGRIFEVIPGLQVSGNNAAGALRFLKFDDTYAGNSQQRDVLVTLTSPTPTSQGRFGQAIYLTAYTVSNSAHFIISEPGANKVHLYRYSRTNVNSTPTLIWSLNLTDYAPGAPSNAQFGHSFYYVDDTNPQGTSSNGVGGSAALNMLVVGAPGISTAYVFKNDISLFNIAPNNNPWVFLESLSGQPNSELGTTTGIVTFSNTGVQHPSAVCILLGAPNYNRNPSGDDRTGAVRCYVTEAAPGYSSTNRLFKPFYHAMDVTAYGSPGNFLQGDRFGAVYNIGFPQLKPNTNSEFVSAWNARVYYSIPKANVNRYYKPGAEPGTIEYSSATPYVFTRDITYNWGTNPFYNYGVQSITLSGGLQYGFLINTVYETYNGGPWTADPYGDFDLVTQGGAGGGAISKVIFEGPSNNTTGIYSLASVFNATNYQGDNWERLNGINISESPSWQFKSLSTSPRNNNPSTGGLHPGITHTVLQNDARGFVKYLPPYPNFTLGEISSYGFCNFRTRTTETRPGFSTLYYLRNGVLSYTNFAADIPGDGISRNVIMGGEDNYIAGKTSIVGSGARNTIGANIIRSSIVGGGDNTIDASGSTGSRFYNFVGSGTLNRIANSDFCSILNGSSNKIEQQNQYSAILGGTNNTILSGLSSVFVLGNALTGIAHNTTYINNLFASNHIQAKTKSFTVPHPTKEGKTLNYGSLESPYHGIRLTGMGKTINGVCIVELPDYISSFVREQGVNIQLTNYKHNNTLYVDNVDISKNNFTVKASGVFGKVFTYEFYWSFTAIRKDVADLIVEV